MSDRPDADSIPELTLAQDRAVARLLAETRHEQPIPAEVAARLDDALGELSHADLEGVSPDDEPGERDEPDEPAVADLVAHRRRRRNAGRLLLAAAAVIIIGVGIGQIVGNKNADDAASNSSADSSRAVDRQSASASSGSADSSAPASGAPSLAAPENAVAPIEFTGDDPTALAAQLTSQLTGAAMSVPASPSPLDPTQQQRFLEQAEPGFTCASPPAGAYGTGELLPAYFNGQAVVLALRPTAQSSPDAATQADVLECGTGAAVTTFTVQLP